MQPIAGMLLNPFLHKQPFANQLGKRAKQPIIITISQAGPAASIPNSSSFRAYYELIMSSFPGSPNVTSPPAHSPPTRTVPSASAVQARAATSCFSYPRPNSTQCKKAIAILQTKNCYSIGRKVRSLNASTTKPIFILSFYWRQQY